jgi:hypothetical protein
MKLNDVKALILDRYNRRQTQMSVFFLEGPPGIGKTEIVIQAAKDLGIPCHVVCLSAMEAADFTGLPMIDPETGLTRYARPNWLPDGPAIIYFDEANRAATDTRQPLMQVLQDRKINGHTVHRDSMFVMAGNMNNGEYDVQDFDPALKDRMAKLSVEPDFLALTKIFAQKYPGCLLEQQWLLKQDKITPRRMEFCLRAIEGIDKKSALYLTLLTAEIGAEGAGAMVAWMANQKRLCAEQIEVNKDGSLSKATKTLIRDTWKKGTEAVPTFTSLAKELIGKMNGSQDPKVQRSIVLQMFAIAEATEDLGCTSIYLDAFNEVGDKSGFATHLFELAHKKDPALKALSELLKEDCAKVTYQDNQ